MRYFTIEEMCASATAKARGIDNTPSDEVIANLTALVDNVLDPLREKYGKPIIVTSGYRCPALNKAVGGVANSQHLVGQAADIVGTPRNKEEVRKLFVLIKAMKLDIDQCLDEKNYSWVHVSYKKNGKNRRQYLNI